MWPMGLLFITYNNWNKISGVNVDVPVHVDTLIYQWMLHRYDLMCECWATNPESRPTFSTILLELKKFSQVSYRNKLYRYNLSKDACSVQREITLFNFWF